MIHLKIRRFQKELPFCSHPMIFSAEPFVQLFGGCKNSSLFLKHSSNFLGDLDFLLEMGAVRRRHHTPEPKAVPSRDATKVQG